MSTASSIKKALQKVGLSYTIERSGGNISGEYLIYDTSILSSRIFVKEHAIDSMMAYDTQALPGDVLLFSTNQHYLVAHKNPEVLLNTVIFYDAALLKCNINNGKILRMSGETWGTNYRKVPVFAEVKTSLRGICTEATISDPTDLMEEKYGNIFTDKLHLYLASGEDLRALDRFEPRSGEYFKVEAVREWVYPGIQIAELSEDKR